MLFEALELERFWRRVFKLLQLRYGCLVSGEHEYRWNDAGSPARPVGFSNVMPTSAESHLQ